MLRCKACNKPFIANHVYIVEDNPDGGYISTKYGIEECCSECKNSTLSDMDYEDLFSDRWVKPVNYAKYSE